MKLNVWEKGVTGTLLLVGSVIMLLPFYWMLNTALKRVEDVLVLPPVWFPIPPQWGNLAQAWDAFFWPLILLDSEMQFTLPIGLQRFQGQYTVDIRMIMSVSLLTTIPVLIVFLFFQRHFISGLAHTSVKG